MENQVRIIGLTSLLAVALFRAYKNRTSLGLMFVVLGTLTYFTAGLGVVLDPAKGLALIALASLLMRPLKLPAGGRTSLFYFLPWAGYVAVLTMVRPATLGADQLGTTGFAYQNGPRAAVQLIQFTGGLAVAAHIQAFLTDPIRLANTLKNWHRALIAVAVIGVYTWIAQQAGLPRPTIGRGGETAYAQDYIISTVVNGRSMPRAYSVSGEPKALASDCVLAIAVGFAAFSLKGARTSTARPPVLASLTALITLVLTLSTAGYAFALLAVPGYAVLSHKALRSSGRTAPIYMALGLTLAGYALSTTSGLLESRTVDRVRNEGAFTVADSGILKHWETTPLDAVVGVGLGGANFVIRKHRQIDHNLIVAPRGLLGIIADTGLTGFLLLVLGFIRCARDTRKWQGNSHLVGLIYIMAVALFTFSNWYLNWAAIGISSSIATLSRKPAAAMLGLDAYQHPVT